MIIKNQQGFIHIILAVGILAVVIVCLWGWVFFDWIPFKREEADNLSARAVAAHESGLTHRAEIRADDRQAERESFNQSLLVFIHTGRELLFVLIVALCALLSVCFMLLLITGYWAHRESMERYHLQAGRQIGIEQRGPITGYPDNRGTGFIDYDHHQYE